ncbi:hypothetical protein SBRCBS47491_009367 [Sporothrix bragantina]|uniref:Xylanolytic transcriptional activator regulatory domain-containing protein n=1 Tax=Sporothrix bragantina TaxID=671064 RepID=A0ABP0CVS0_9PEZI
MKDAAPKSSQRAPSRMPTRRDIDTFRICTTQDFDSPQTPKRKPGPYTLASCHWEVEDGRKRQRRRASSRAGQQIQGSSPQAGAGAGPAEAKTPAPLHDEQEAAAEKRAPPPATSAPQNGNRISQQSFSDDPPPCLPSVTAAAATAAEEFPKAVFLPRSGSVHQPPGLASIFETQVGSHELISTEPFIAEFYPYDTTTIQAAELQDWPDMQNFVLDFSGIGEGGAEGAFPSSSQINDATTTTHQASYHASYHAATTAVPSPRSPLVDLSGISGISGHNVQQPPNRPRLIRIRYYRRFGPTAIVPGLRKLSVVVNPQQEEEDSQTPEVSSVRMADSYEPETAVGSSDAAAASANFPTRNISHGSSPGGSVGSSYGSRKHLFFDSGAPGIPRADVISPILDIFFAHFGGHFPFHHPHILGGHVRSGEASSFLLNAIAALTLRFCSQEQEGVATAGSPLIAILQAQFPESAQVWQRGQVYLKKAKEQLVPLLSIPAPEVVAGLVILAWAEFGDNNEAGLWMFTGMAIRMAQDLGFHRLPDTAADLSSDVFDVFHDQARPTLDGRVVLTDEQSAVHQQKARLVMFWSVLFLDVCVSLGTGRLPSIRPSEVEVAVPTYADMKLAQLDFSEPVTLGNMIFPTTARFMLLFSEAVEALNERGWAGSGSSDWNEYKK